MLFRQNSYRTNATSADAAASIVEALQSSRRTSRIMRESQQLLTGYMIDNNSSIENKRYSILGRNVAYSACMAAAEKINSLGIHGVSSDGIGGLGFYLYKTYSFKVDQVRDAIITDDAKNLLFLSINEDPTNFDSMYASLIYTLSKNIALNNIGLTAQVYAQHISYPSSVLETSELVNSRKVNTETWDKILDRIIGREVRDFKQIDEVMHSI